MRLPVLKKLFVISLVLALSACGSLWDRDDDDATPPAEQPSVVAVEEVKGEGDEDLNLVTVLNSDERFSAFMELMKLADLEELLSSAEYTVFAPINSALTQMDEGFLASLKEGDERLREFILFHIVAGQILSEDMASADNLSSLSDLTLEIHSEGDLLYVNNSKILSVDQSPVNGVIHAIDQALLPTTMYTIAELVEANGQLSSLKAALHASGLLESLREAGPHTIFAPNNAAFVGLGEGTFQSMLQQPDNLREILHYHLVKGRYDVAALGELNELGSSSQKRIQLELDEAGDVYVNGYRLLRKDIKAANGIIHIIETVLDPSQAANMPDPATEGPSVFQLAEEHGSFGIFTKALLDTGLAATLEQEGPYTVFAPTDEAFQALGDEALQKLLSQPSELAKILRYHMTSSQLLAADIAKLSKLVSLFAGQPLLISTNNDEELFVNEARIIERDLTARNGVVHIVDRLLIPGEQAASSLIELLKQQGFSTFAMLLQEADLNDLLNGSGPYTIFAPSNEAFRKLGDKVLNRLRADPAELSLVLRYHIVRQNLPAAAALEAADLSSAAAGRLLKVKSSEAGEILVNEARIIQADILADNAVIHGIDRVLLPAKDVLPAIFDLAREHQEFSIFMEILDAAGLTSQVLIDRPVTIFAPTNKAFSYLSEESIAGLKNNPELMTRILQYHIVDMKLNLGQLLEYNQLSSQLRYHRLIITDRGDNEVYVNSALLVSPNLEAHNGMIHGIDRLLLPRDADIPEIPGALIAPEDATEEKPADDDVLPANLLEAMRSKAELSIFVSLLEQSELLATVIREEAALTVFAPTNAAFAALSTDIAKLLNSTPELLDMLLAQHIVAGTYEHVAIVNSHGLQNIGGEILSIDISLEDRPSISGTVIESFDHQAANGVYHVLNSVLLPASLHENR